MLNSRAYVIAHQEQIISSAEQGFTEYQVPQLVLMSVEHGLVPSPASGVVSASAQAMKFLALQG